MLSFQQFMECQGLPSKLVVHQDNTSTILSMNKGEATSNRSRHVHIRYFWCKQHIDDGTVELKYVPTDFMLADILTKPLQGALFRRLRQLLLNDEWSVMRSAPTGCVRDYRPPVLHVDQIMSDHRSIFCFHNEWLTNIIAVTCSHPKCICDVIYGRLSPNYTYFVIELVLPIFILFYVPPRLIMNACEPRILFCWFDR